MAGLTCDDVRELAGAYVLDALEPAEAHAVAEHLATCPEPHEEMFELGGVVPYLAETVELVEPRADLRARIMAAAARDLELRTADAPAAVGAETAVAATSAPAVQPVATAPVPIHAPRRGALRPAWLIGLAAVLAIVALGAWNVSLQRDLSNARDYQARVTELLALARSPGARVAILTDSALGPNSQPNGLAVIPADAPGRLVVAGLTPTSGAQVYVAWSIVDGQAPVAVGSFTVGSDGVGYYSALPQAPPISLTVAVTLEPVATVTAPSGPIVSSGQVPASS